MNEDTQQTKPQRSDLSNRDIYTYDTNSIHLVLANVALIQKLHDAIRYPMVLLLSQGISTLIEMLPNVKKI